MKLVIQRGERWISNTALRAFHRPLEVAGRAGCVGYASLT